MKTALLAASFLAFARLAHADALTTAEAALEAAWAATPFSVRQAFFVVGQPDGFGLYVKHPDAAFKPGETLIVYAEPIGFAYKDAKDGTSSFGFDIDVTIKTAAGKVGLQQKSWQKIGLVSHAHNHEFNLALTLDVTGADPGDYVLDYTLHDQNSGKVTDITLPFTIAK